jgi:hypothetical protein
MLRSAGAVLGGALVTFAAVIAGTVAAATLLAGSDGAVTPSYLVANLVVSFGAAAAGGWLVARLAPRRPLVHASVLAALIVLVSAPGLGAPAPGQPAWYPAVILLIGMVGIATGAALRQGGGARTASLQET